MIDISVLEGVPDEADFLLDLLQEIGGNIQQCRVSADTNERAIDLLAEYRQVSEEIKARLKTLLGGKQA